MDANELGRRYAGLGQPADGQRGGVGGKKAAWRQHRLSLLRDAGLEFAVFKHGLNDQVAARQVGRLLGGVNARQQLGLCRLRHAAFVHAGLGELGTVGFAGLGFFQAHVFQHGFNALAGLHVGNARAHHARPQQTYLGGLEARRLARARLAAANGAHVEKEGVDHGAGVAARHQLGQVAALNAQRRRQVNLKAFHHAGQNGLGRGVQATRLLAHHGRGHRQHAGHFGVGRGAAWHFVVFVFPGVLGCGVGVDPGQCLGAHLALGLL